MKQIQLRKSPYAYYQDEIRRKAVNGTVAKQLDDICDKFWDTTCVIADCILYDLRDELNMI